MTMSITELNVSEVGAVFGGVGLRMVMQSLVGVIPKVALVTAKKLSMVYCVGKELKNGLQALDGWSVVSLASCVGITTFAREAVPAVATLFFQKSKVL